MDEIRHGPANAKGRCPWCGKRVDMARARPDSFEVSDLTDAYGQHYDPDYGALSPAEVRARYQTGQGY